MPRKAQSTAPLELPDVPVIPASGQDAGEGPVARNGGRSESENDAPPADQRTPEVRSARRDGPDVDPTNGAYRPATYPVVQNIKDGKETTKVSLTREDR